MELIFILILDFFSLFLKLIFFLFFRRYGSYGACIDATYDYKRTVLLDRGIVYAIAHIRGGGEMGRHW